MYAWSKWSAVHDHHRVTTGDRNCSWSEEPDTDGGPTGVTDIESLLICRVEIHVLRRQKAVASAINWMRFLDCFYITTAFIAWFHSFLRLWYRRRGNELSLILVDKKPIHVENPIWQQTVNINNEHKRCNGPPVSLRRLPLLLLLLPCFLPVFLFFPSFVLFLYFLLFSSFFYSLVSSPTAPFISRTYEALVTTIPSEFHMSYRWRCCWKSSPSPPIFLPPVLLASFYFALLIAFFFDLPSLVFASDH